MTPPRPRQTVPDGQPAPVATTQSRIVQYPPGYLRMQIPVAQSLSDVHGFPIPSPASRSCATSTSEVSLASSKPDSGSAGSESNEASTGAVAPGSSSTLHAAGLSIASTHAANTLVLHATLIGRMRLGLHAFVKTLVGE